ncbi:MAG: pyrroline-5-carboxylate reductase [Campylobacteraceae bacterium]
MKLSFLGNGVMACAMIDGLLENGYKIEVFGRDIEKLKELNKKYQNGLEIFEYKQDTDITGKSLIICVKPYALSKISHFFTGTADMIISVLANTSLEELQKNIKSKSYIRAMPNIAASYKKSMTTLTGDVTKKDEALKVLGAIGRTLWVDSEKEFDIATILAGSSPAFLALVSEALIDGAVKEGLKRNDAAALTKGLFDGFAALLENYPHPALIKDAVMSPGGVTAKGIAILEEGKVRDSFIKVTQKK